MEPILIATDRSDNANAAAARVASYRPTFSPEEADVLVQLSGALR